MNPLPWIAAILALCLLGGTVAKAQVVTSHEAIRVSCMPPLSAEWVAKSMSVEPVAEGVDRVGDLWTLWRAPDGGWWLTYRKGQTGEHCNVAAGEGWQKATTVPGVAH